MIEKHYEIEVKFDKYEESIIIPLPADDYNSARSKVDYINNTQLPYFIGLFVWIGKQRTKCFSIYNPQRSNLFGN